MLDTKRKDEALFGKQSEGTGQNTELFSNDHGDGDTDLFQEISTEKPTAYTG